jgi:hypothetical protein
VVGAISFVPSSVLAAIPVPIEGNTITLRDIVLLVQRVMNIGIILATLGVVAMIVYAGFQMATARGDEGKFKTGKKTLTYAIYGALVVFGVGLIVNTIANVAYNPANVLY